METILAKALGQDVTQLAAEEKQRLLSRLLGRLAHEIRNPLSSLDIHVQLLEEDLAHLTPEVRDKLSGRVEILHGELRRLENIVKHFLRLAGPSELNLESVDVPETIAHVCELLRPEAQEREIELREQVDSSLPVLSADRVQLTQALLNLLINALQAVERRGSIEVSAAQRSEFVVIGVRDTGPGVPPEKASAIFEPYYTTKPEGSGLGLWIAQQIALAHGGNISVENLPEGGALFTLRLPWRGKGAEGG